MKWLTIVAAFVAGGALAVTGYRYWYAPAPSTDGQSEAAPARTEKQQDPAVPATEPPPQEVAALGRIEPSGGVIAVGGTAGDRVRSVEVQAGDLVERGADLAILESHALRKEELVLTQRQLDDAKQQQSTELVFADSLVEEAEAALELTDLAQLDIDSQQARLTLAEASLAVAKNDLARLEGLEANLVSARDLEHQRLLVQQAEADLNSAKSALVRLQRTAGVQRRQAEAKLATAKASRGRIASAASIATMEQSVALAERKLELAVIQAPAAGRVLDIQTRAGESIGGRPILLLANTDRMTVVAEVYEDNVRWVRPGQRASIDSDALADSLSGVVDRVGTVVAGNQASSLNPTERADIRVVEVEISLDSDGALLAAQLIHLQVDVTIRLDSAPADTPPAAENILGRTAASSPAATSAAAP